MTLNITEWSTILNVGAQQYNSFCRIKASEKGHTHMLNFS